MYKRQYQYGLPGTFAPIADYGLLAKAVDTAKAQGTNVVVGNILDVYKRQCDKSSACRSKKVVGERTGNKDYRAFQEGRFWPEFGLFQHCF